jgi:RNA polymerase sigma-70 factor (ECF subfamily)
MASNLLPSRVGSPKLRLVRRSAPAEQGTAPRHSLDDSELLAAVRAGEVAAAAAFHDRIRPHVDATIRRLLGAGDIDHQDIAQKALIEIVLTIHRYRGECSLDSWVSRVTANIAFKHLRRRKTERRLFDILNPEDIALPSSSRTSRQILLRDVSHRIRHHLDRIDVNKSWTVVLHDVCGYDLKEIAGITGVSVAAAQTRLVRGRRELHDRIAADPELAGLLDDLGGRE